MIEFKSVTKSFGTKIANDNIIFSVDNGNCLCILGPNGAGKTTALNLAMGLINPDKGQVLINKLTFKKDSKRIYNILGCMPEKSILIEEISGDDFLRFHGLLFGMKKNELKRRIKDLMGFFFEDEEYIHKKISYYSKGMKKRLEFCAALIHSPDILILDEPFSGLDPISSYKLTWFLNEFKSHNKSILISSHDLLYIKEIATKVAFIYDGSIKFNGSANEFFNDKISDLKSFLNYIPTKKSEKINKYKMPEWL